MAGLRQGRRPLPPRVAVLVIAIVAVCLVVCSPWIIRLATLSADVGAPSPTSTTPAPGDRPPQQLRVTRVVDGDTLVGQAPDGSAVRVRLLGIDAPEVAHGSGGVAHCGGEAATTTLRQWVEGQDVILTVDPVADHRDRFDRVLAYVAPAWDTQLDVAFQLVEQGLAVAWFPRGEPAPTRFGSYQVAEVRARGLRIGRWADCADLGR